MTVSAHGHTRSTKDNTASGVHPSPRSIGGWEGGGPGGPTKLKACAVSPYRPFARRTRAGQSVVPVRSEPVAGSMSGGVVARRADGSAGEGRVWAAGTSQKESVGNVASSRPRLVPVTVMLVPPDAGPWGQGGTGEGEGLGVDGGRKGVEIVAGDCDGMTPEAWP